MGKVIKIRIEAVVPEPLADADMVVVEMSSTVGGDFKKRITLKLGDESMTFAASGENITTITNLLYALKQVGSQMQDDQGEHAFNQAYPGPVAVAPVVAAASPVIAPVQPWWL